MTRTAEQTKARAQANARLAALTRATHAHIDRCIEAQKPAETTCSKGCAGCCRQLVGASRAEASYIVQVFPAVVRSALPQLREHNARIERTFGGAGFDPQDVQTRTMFAKAYWALNMPCAFLTPEQTCGVYEARPFVCRAWFALSDPKHCFTGKEDPRHQGWAPTSIAKMPGAAHAWKHRRDVLGALPSMVLEAWEKRS